MPSDMSIIPNFQMKTTLLLAWSTLNLLELAIFRGRTRSEAVPIGSGTLGAQDGAETPGGRFFVPSKLRLLPFSTGFKVRNFDPHRSHQAVDFGVSPDGFITLRLYGILHSADRCFWDASGSQGKLMQIARSGRPTCGARPVKFKNENKVAISGSKLIFHNLPCPFLGFHFDFQVNCFPFPSCSHRCKILRSLEVAEVREGGYAKMGI